MFMFQSKNICLRGIFKASTQHDISIFKLNRESEY